MDQTDPKTIKDNQWSVLQLVRLPLVILVEVFTERPQWWEDVHEEEWEPARDEAEHDQTWGIQNILKLVYTDKKIHKIIDPV